MKKYDDYFKFIPNKEKWNKGVSDELAFWDNYIATKGNVFHQDYLFRTDPNAELQTEIKELLKGVDDPFIIDVGAGIMTYLGKKIEGKPVHILPLDALAVGYDEILYKYGVTPPIRTMLCDSEAIIDYEGKLKPNLITARNTLDHSYDPVEAIVGMVSILAPNGIVYLNNYKDTAIHCGWEGLHQWNFYLEKGCLIMESDGGKFNVNHILDKLYDRLMISNTYDEKTNEITTIIKFK
jgi:hypothetical protein